MGINLLTFNQKTVTPKDDALIQQFALGQDGFFYGGVVTYTGGNTLHFASGEGVICGREFVIEDTDVSAALPASGTLLGQVYIHIDLSNADTPIELICETAAELTELTKDENMNVDNGEYDLQLCTFTATTSAITDLSSKVTYIKKGGAGSNDNLATVEEGSTSSQAYVIGQHLVYDDVYCEVIESIAENDAFVVYPAAGANIKPAKVGNEIFAINQNLTLNYSDSSLPSSTTFNEFAQMVLEKLYPKAINMYKNGQFGIEVENGAYQVTSGYTISAFSNQGGVLSATLQGNNHAFTLVSKEKIDFSGLTTVTFKNSIGNITLDVSGYSGEGYLCVHYTHPTGGGVQYGISVCSQKPSFLNNVISGLSVDRNTTASTAWSMTSSEITVQ